MSYEDEDIARRHEWVTGAGDDADERCDVCGAAEDEPCSAGCPNERPIIFSDQLWWIGRPMYAPDRLEVLRVEHVEGGPALIEEAAIDAVYRGRHPSVDAVALVRVSFDAADRSGLGAGRARAIRVISLDELDWVEALEALLGLLAEERSAA